VRRFKLTFVEITQCGVPQYRIIDFSLCVPPLIYNIINIIHGLYQLYTKCALIKK